MNEKIYLTVMGRNDRGIIAVVSAVLLAYDINICDITQKIMGDNFVLLMELESALRLNLPSLQQHMEESTSQYRMKFMLAHEDLFNTMHRV